MVVFLKISSTVHTLLTGFEIMTRCHGVLYLCTLRINQLFTDVS